MAIKVMVHQATRDTRELVVVGSKKGRPLLLRNLAVIEHWFHFLEEVTAHGNTLGGVFHALHVANEAARSVLPVSNPRVIAL